MGLDAIEIVMAVEERFAVSIPDEDATKATTPRLLVDRVMRKLTSSQSHKAWSREQVSEIVMGIIVEQTGKTDFTEDSSFVNEINIS